MDLLKSFEDTITYEASAEKRDQIDKKFFFEITQVLDQMTKSTSILLRNIFLKKFSIWSLFPALTSYDDILINKKHTSNFFKSLSLNTSYLLIAYISFQ